MGETRTETVSEDFAVVHATVQYGDGRTENFEYVDMYDLEDAFVLQDIDSDDWECRVDLNGDPHLHHGEPIEEQVILSKHNFEKIEVNWTEELTAVAEVEVTETTTGWIRPLTQYEAEIVDGVTLWDQVEWEAYGEQSDD